MKRVYFLLLSVIISSLAKAEIAEVEGIFYNLDETTSTAAVTSHRNNEGFNYSNIKGTVSIPAAITVGKTEYAVTEIGNSAFESCEGIETAVLPSSIIKIGNYAFSECFNLKNITLPTGISDLGIGAFANTSLRAVELTGDITTIAATTFAGTEIEVITLPSSVKTIEKNAFSGCEKLREIHLGNSLTTIGDGAFARCKTLSTIEFPATLRNIGKNAFNSCQALENLNLNKTTVVSDNAFEKCTSLANIDFGTGELKLGFSAFSECTALKSLKIPANVIEIGQYAFYDCLGLETVSFDDGDATLTLGNDPFANDPISELYVGRNITTATKNDNVFSSNNRLSKITLGNSVTTVSPELFSYMPALEEVDFGPNVTEIGAEAFASCPKLKTVKCGNVADWAKIDFKDSYANPLSYGANLYINGELLTTLNLPDGKAKIGENSFTGYSKLTEVTIPASVNSIGQQAFMDCTDIRRVNFGGSVATIGGRAFRNCTAIAEVRCPSLEAWLGNGFETALSNPLSYGAKLYAGDNLIEDINVPSGISAIGEYAFCDYTSITRAIISESVSEIGRSAFQDCTALTEIELGAEVNSLGKKAFNGAPLTAITSRNTVPPTFDTASTTATFGNYNATVYVPVGSLETYYTNEYWKNFANIVEKDFSGIDGAISTKETPFRMAGNTITANSGITIYGIEGTEKARLNPNQSISLSNGIYIIHSADTSFKIAVCQ